MKQMNYNIRISGKGKQLASRFIPSIDLEKELSLNNGAIFNNFGVKTRYWAGDNETNSSLGASALTKALKDAGLQFKDLDLLLNASATYDYPLPTTSSFIQRELDEPESGVPGLDVNSSCLSFLSGLQVAASLIYSGMYSRIGIVTSEISSRAINPDNIETYSLFGDGAVAFIIEKSSGDSYISNFKLHTYSEGAFYTIVKGGGNVMHYHNPKSKEHSDDFYFQMEGSKVLKFTIRKLNNFLVDYQALIGKKINEFQHIVPHQASKLGLLYFKKYYNLKTEQFHETLEKYGNTIAASIPLTLYDVIDKNKIQRGDEVLLIGTAAGITIGAVVLKY